MLKNKRVKNAKNKQNTDKVSEEVFGCTVLYFICTIKPCVIRTVGLDLLLSVSEVRCPQLSTCDFSHQLKSFRLPTGKQLLNGTGIKADSSVITRTKHNHNFIFFTCADSCPSCLKQPINTQPMITVNSLQAAKSSKLKEK